MGPTVYDLVAAWLQALAEGDADAADALKAELVRVTGGGA